MLVLVDDHMLQLIRRVLMKESMNVYFDPRVMAQGKHIPGLDEPRYRRIGKCIHILRKHDAKGGKAGG